jgi:ribose transport system substrate-binding protein
MMRMIGVVLFSGLLLLTGCSAPLPPIPEKQIEKPITIAFVYKAMSNPYFISMAAGAKQAATEEGVILIERACNNEEQVNEQIAIVEELIGLKVSGICLAPISPVELVSVAKKAQDNKIPLITVGSKLDDAQSEKVGLERLIIKVDNVAAQYEGVKKILRQEGRPLEVGVIEGIPGSEPSENRKVGLVQAIAEQPGSRMVGVESGYWRADKGYWAAKNLLEKHPNLEIICALNDLMALGALQYLQETGRQQVMVLGFDGIDEAKEAIRLGTMKGSIVSPSYEFGYQGVKLIVRRIRGEKIPTLTTLDAKLIMADDLKNGL